MKIHIVGAPGSGKTTLARQLTRYLECLHIELDALHWQPCWNKTPVGRFQKSVIRLLQQESWLVDGSYESVWEIVWKQADKVIWLDYPPPVIVWRLMRRGVQHIVDKTDLWGSGNHESLRWLLSKESIIVRSLKAHRHMQATYPKRIDHGRNRRIDFIHLQSERETSRWLLSFVGAHGAA